MKLRVADLKTDKYRSILDPLMHEERKTLKESIKQEGVRDAIVIDHENNVVD